MQITLAQAAAFGRHVVSFSMGAVTTLAAFHLLTSNDASGATNAISEISSGVSQIVAGVSTLVAVSSGVYAAWTASPLSQLIAAAKNPQVHQIVAAPDVANAVPNSKVVAK